MGEMESLDYKYKCLSWFGVVASACRVAKGKG